jgi:hypothetical protein
MARDKLSTLIILHALVHQMRATLEEEEAKLLDEIVTETQNRSQGRVELTQPTLDLAITSAIKG